MNKQPRLVAFDLDGTLLNSEKELTPGTLAALQAANDRGIALVPATGRFYRGMPQALRELPFVRYAITINGALVYDAAHDEALYQSELDWALAAEVMAYLDGLDLIYDCYRDNWGWITRAFLERAPELITNPHYLRMLFCLRTPVDELKQELRETRRDVQKIIIFTRTDALQEQLLAELPVRFPGLIATSSVPRNLELNAPAANKGAALRALADHLGIAMDETMALGDGLNDCSMLRAAGIGVAMAGGHPAALASAGFQTDDCDHDGAAKALRRFCGL